MSNIVETLLQQECDRLTLKGYKYAIHKSVEVISTINFYIDLANDIAIITDVVIDNKNLIKDIHRLKMILMSPSGLHQDYISGENFNNFVANRNIKGKIYNPDSPSTAPESTIITPLKLHIIRISPFKS